ncbi:hypothetical protein ACFY3G_18235 [Streptomyces phaeochromogenes]|uniref:hypothetical protein n=1 Tax=Streptomyces phaeochromogenes TaxID=1923 RepID=UPI00369887E3
MGELLPFGNGEIAQTRRGIKNAQLKLDGLLEYNAQAMGYTCLLDMRRQLLAAENPGVEPLLRQLEISFVADALQIQSTMYRGR